MADALGFATKGGKSNPKAIASSRGTQTDINAIRRNAGVLGDVIGQGDDASYKQFVQQQQQAKPQIQAKPQQQPATKSQPSPAQNLFNKFKKIGKEVASSATTGEQKFSQGIARTLPGGTADIQAEQKASEQAQKNMQLVKNNVKNPAQAKKIIQSNAAEADTASKNATSILNKLPTKKQIALGAASTAADVLTAGSLPEIKALRGANVTSKVARGTVAAGAYGTAGALNTAAGGGNKKQIAENFVAGAALPGVLRVAGKGVAAGTKAGAQAVGKGMEALSPHTQKALDNIMNTVRAPRSLIEKVKANTEFAANKQKETAKAAIEVPKLEQKIELINAKKADGKFSNVDKVKVKQLEDQKKAYGIPTATATDTKAPVASTKESSETATTPQAQLPSGAKLEQSPVPKESSVTSDLSSSYQSHYTPSDNPHANENFAHDYIKNNTQEALDKYNKIIKDKFGSTNVVAGDEAKYAIPGFEATKSAHYHEPGSALAKVKYEQLLADPSTKDRPVLLNAGGSGAGKTHSLKATGQDIKDFAAVIDTNSNKLGSTTSKIDQALKSGRQVEINYTHRDILDAFKNGVMPRAKTEGRIVPIEGYLDTHFGAHEVIPQLVEKYKDNPNVNFTLIDNHLGEALPTRVTDIDKLPKMSYDRSSVQDILGKEVDRAKQKGIITPEEHQTYIGERSEASSSSPKNSSSNGGQNQRSESKNEVKVSTRKETEYKPNKGEPVNVPIEQPKIKQPEIKTSKLANSTEQKAIDKKLTQGFEGKPEYAKVNTKDQASAATELLKSDPERSTRIALGQELPPEHLLPESVYVAVENKALKDGNVDLLRRLATEGSLSSEATGMGQRIRMLGERDPDSAVSAMRKLADARKKAIEKRTNKPVAKAISDEVKKIRAAKPKLTKETVGSFIESLKC